MLSSKDYLDCVSVCLSVVITRFTFVNFRVWTLTQVGYVREVFKKEIGQLRVVKVFTKLFKLHYF
jgi:hypothetical protein